MTTPNHLIRRYDKDAFSRSLLFHFVVFALLCCVWRVSSKFWTNFSSNWWGRACQQSNFSSLLRYLHFSYRLGVHNHRSCASIFPSKSNAWTNPFVNHRVSFVCDCCSTRKFNMFSCFIDTYTSCVILLHSCNHALSALCKPKHKWVVLT